MYLFCFRFLKFRVKTNAILCMCVHLVVVVAVVGTGPRLAGLSCPACAASSPSGGAWAS